MKFDIGGMCYHFRRDQVAEPRDLEVCTYVDEEVHYGESHHTITFERGYIPDVEGDTITTMDVISEEQFEDFTLFCNILDNIDRIWHSDKKSLCGFYLDALAGNGY